MAKLTNLGEIRERSEEDMQAHIEILNQIVGRRNDPNYPEHIEPLPYAIVTTQDGTNHGYIAAERYAGDMKSICANAPAALLDTKIDRCIQVIDGLRILNNVGLRWGDNKTGNVFMTHGNHPQLHLGDFGGGCFYDQLHRPQLQEIRNQDVVRAIDIIRVIYTPQYLTTPHLNRFIEAVVHENDGAYMAAHRQMELFGNANILFELLTDEYVADLVNDEDEGDLAMDIVMLHDLPLSVRDQIEAALGDDNNWEVILDDALNNAPNGAVYVEIEGVSFYPPSDKNGHAWTAWVNNPIENDLEEGEEDNWVECRRDGNQWRPVAAVERGNGPNGEHFEIVDDPQNPLDANNTNTKLSTHLFGLEYDEELPQPQRELIDRLCTLFQRACSPNPPEGFAIDNANFLNEMEVVLRDVQQQFQG